MRKIERAKRENGERETEVHGNMGFPISCKEEGSGREHEGARKMKIEEWRKRR